MKRFVLTVLLFSTSAGFTACAAPSAKKNTAAGLSGAWSAKICDQHNPQLECGTFVVYLVQNKEGFCGEHFVATPGAARLDEGEPGSVLGSAKNGDVVLVVKSGRNDAIYMGRIELSETGLLWKRVGMIVAGTNDEPPILPDAIALQKDQSQGAQEHLRALKDQGCAWPSWVPASSR